MLGLRSLRGLTIIETIIAVTLFTVALVAIMGLYPVSSRAARQAQGQLLATHLAERELELTRSMDFDAVASRNENYQLEIELNGVKNTLEFEVSVDVSEVRPGLKEVKAEVSWLGIDSYNKKLELETYVARLSP